MKKIVIFSLLLLIKFAFPVYASYYEEGEVIAEVLQIDDSTNCTIEIIAKKITGGHIAEPETDFSYYLFGDKRKIPLSLPNTVKIKDNVLLRYSRASGPRANNKWFSTEKWDLVNKAKNKLPFNRKAELKKWKQKEPETWKITSKQPFQVNNSKDYVALTHKEIAASHEIFLYISLDPEIKSNFTLENIKKHFDYMYFILNSKTLPYEANQYMSRGNPTVKKIGMPCSEGTIFNITEYRNGKLFGNISGKIKLEDYRNKMVLNRDYVIDFSIPIDLKSIHPERNKK